MKTKKRNTMCNACYECKHRGEIPGNAHSKCLHPSTKDIHNNPMLGIMGILGGVPSIQSNGIHVKGDPQGIRSGWFSHPLNFDPVWLVECDGFEEVNKTEKVK